LAKVGTFALTNAPPSGILPNQVGTKIGSGEEVRTSETMPNVKTVAHTLKQPYQAQTLSH